MNYELTEESNRIEHPLDINIYLKEHQLAMVYKCIEIEEFNLCSYGVMNDKPGSGKSYAILAFILHMKINNKYNIDITTNKIFKRKSYEIKRSFFRI